MNGKRGSSIEINIPPIGKAKLAQTTKKHEGKFSVSCKSVWEFCKEDSNRVTFSLKVGLAVVLASLLILCQAPYRVFGTNIIWSILTVAMMFEYTVGATFNRGLNRALGSLLAGAMAIFVTELALRTGKTAEPIIIGFSIFIVGAVTSFMKVWPSLVPYEYGFRVVLFTYCLIVVSGYRMGNPIRTAMDRLYSIAIGGIVAVVVNVLVFPVWAGEQLHKELVSNFACVADALDECVGKYLEGDGPEHPEFTKAIMDDFPDEPAYRKCRSTLNSSAKLESLADSAKWEPPHGRFKHFLYPYSEYVKVGAVLRYCTYEVMALHGVLHSQIQAPYNLRIAFHREIEDAGNEASELIRCLGNDISNMQQTLKTQLLKRVHISIEQLQRAMDMHSYLLTSTHDPPDNSSSVLSNNGPTNHTADVENNPLQQNSDPPSHEMTRKQSSRVRALESTATLSLPTFTSLLVEFVARLDHLVEAVDELSKMAEFKREPL